MKDENLWEWWMGKFVARLRGRFLLIGEFPLLLDHNGEQYELKRSEVGQEM
jgi:hemin uptake protein HemP